MFSEEELPFLSTETEMGSQLRRCVIDSNMDDDVMTDDELAQGAKVMLQRSLEEAILDFVGNQSSIVIKNLCAE